ncbi:hypothetical protein SAMN04488066_1157 [Halorubrum aquaticum]|uniref:Conditioned medium-induced protein 4 n=1 Tax=Halorubrum aquaticum TaxID=387340 RepID=A0A1I3BT24_9EURY|nr:hypothetical protein [Halorubrum aquaticum]SFH65079.1 hypothetical protein SAMN04488066_1157 [Halorubrum aquaticum]
MDEKTEELRDIFVDATGSDTVTDRQEESPGSLVDRDDDAVEARVAELVATMRERYDFDAGSGDGDADGDAPDVELTDAEYERVVFGFFDDEDDAAIADALGGSDSGPDARTERDARTVRDARLDLHLVADADRDAPFEYAALKRLLAADRSVEAIAAKLDADAGTVREFVPVARADLASTRVNDRFRDEFRALLTDADIEDAHAATARDDGLREATEDIETDVSL